MQQGENLALN